MKAAGKIYVTLVSAVVIISVAIVLPPTASAADAWTQYGGNQLNNPVVADGIAPGLTQPRWVTLNKVINEDVQFIQVSTPVVFDAKIICHAEVYIGIDVASYVLALDVYGGRLVWAAQVEAREWGSWSSPAVYAEGGLVLMASGASLHILEAETGNEVAVVELPKAVVNSSVTVAEGIAFLTTHIYDGVADLLAVNLDEAQGPVGEVLWSTPTGVSWGNTPAFYTCEQTGEGLVVTAESLGYVKAYSPVDGSLVWTFPVNGAGSWEPEGGVFTGGVSIQGDFVYVSSYNFDDGEFNSFTYKLDAKTGDEIWRTPSERASTVPVIDGDTVIVSGGLIDDWGKITVPRLTAYDNATGDQIWDFEDAGGWDNTPVVVNGVCYAGRFAEGGTYDRMYALDLAKTPSEPGFIVSQFDDAGGTPSYAGGNIYSFGIDGLYAFGSAPTNGQPLRGDADLDCSVDAADIIFIRNRLRNDTGIDNNWQADVNGDGRIDLVDLVVARNNAGRECLMTLEIEEE